MSAERELRGCAIDGCNEDHEARGWCRGHYMRWRRHGDPLAGRVSQGVPAQTFERLIGLDTDECIDWPHAQRYGYGCLSHNGRMIGSHVLALERTFGARPEGKQAAHSCGRSICMNPRHLRWATAVENEHDKRTHDTLARGSRHGCARLSENDVLEIRLRLEAGVSAVELGRAFRGVHPDTIRAIARRRTWAWLKDGEK